ncbi:MAG: hypothetical protein R2883_01820 [Caldisericia bacterium]
MSTDWSCTLSPSELVAISGVDYRNTRIDFDVISESLSTRFTKYVWFGLS